MERKLKKLTRSCALIGKEIELCMDKDNDYKKILIENLEENLNKISEIVLKNFKPRKII